MGSCLMESQELLIDNTEARLNTHEAVCELRYESICARLKRIEQILITAAGFILASLVAIALKLN
ncbi:hypothetical protein [Bacteriophage sp.]|nr:hypothetical protein [Bacteriophage sp.]